MVGNGSMMSEWKLREEMCEIGRRVYAKGFAAANDGNISYRLDENRVLCTPTRVSKGFMKPDDLCIVDLEGNQAVDFLLYNAHDTAERYSAPDTIAAQGAIFLTTGSVLRSCEGRPLMTVVADQVGRHDTIGGACSKESNTLRYGHHTRHQHACVENFLREGARWGLGKRDLVSNINWYMNVPVEEDGTLGIVDGLSARG